MNKIDRDTNYHCWDMAHKGDNRDTKSIEMDASWKALHDQIPKEPKQKGKRIFRGKDGKLKEYSPSEAWVKGNNFKKANESKNINKKLIRLTESDLHRIIKESVNDILNEISGKDYYVSPIERMKRGKISTANTNTTNSTSPSNANTSTGYNKGIYDDTVGDDLRASRGVAPSSIIHDDGDAAALRYRYSRFGRRF